MGSASPTAGWSAACSLGLRRALSPTFRAGAMVFFIPWRVVAEESGAAHFGFGGAMLLDLPGPALRLLTDVADFHFRGPRIIAVAGNLGHLWGEQHRIETRTKPNHSWVNSGRLTIGGNYSRSPIMIYQMAVAIFAGLVVAGAAVAQSSTPASEKQETSCTTSSAATSGSAGEKTSNSLAMEKSAILPNAGGSNSAA